MKNKDKLFNNQNLFNSLCIGYLLKYMHLRALSTGRTVLITGWLVV